MHVFFIQLEPDIDYITPIVYKLASNGKKITIICFNPLIDIDSDYRLQYLKIYPSVSILYLHQTFTSLRLLFKLLLGLASFLSNTQLEKFYAFITKKLLTGRLLELFLIKNNAVSLTIDEGMPKHSLKIINCAKNIGICSIMTPTGALMYGEGTKELMDGTIFDTNLKVDYRIVSPNKDISKFTNKTRKPVFMGVARYCSEWQEINSKLISDLADSYMLPSSRGKLKVLIFSRPNIGLVRDNSLIIKIANDKDIDLIFKNKPRGVKDNPGTYDSCPSALLIQWADVVIGSVSSIVLDIFYYKKQFIFLSYLSNDNVGNLENSDICMVALDEKMAMRYLSKIKQKPYNSSNIKIKEYYDNKVYEKSLGFDVLGDYYKLYTNLN